MRQLPRALGVDRSCRRRAELFGYLARRARRPLIKIAGALALDLGFRQHCIHAGRIKVNIGDRRKQGIQNEGVDGLVARVKTAGTVSELSDGLARFDEQVLKRGNLGGLAADADRATTGAMGCLFALIAKHRLSPPVRLLVAAP